mmetsp:Transcript_20430/g.62195  ORF Transcript_20430/g.62195 Transcript_20430/m.62195 type:complete len:428 (+) Transcript_20430:3682-4965(+)
MRLLLFRHGRRRAGAILGRFFLVACGVLRRFGVGVGDHCIHSRLRRVVCRRLLRCLFGGSRLCVAFRAGLTARTVPCALRHPPQADAVGVRALAAAEVLAEEQVGIVVVLFAHHAGHFLIVLRLLGRARVALPGRFDDLLAREDLQRGVPQQARVETPRAHLAFLLLLRRVQVDPGIRIHLLVTSHLHGGGRSYGVDPHSQLGRWPGRLICVQERQKSVDGAICRLGNRGGHRSGARWSGGRLAGGHGMPQSRGSILSSAGRFKFRPRAIQAQHILRDHAGPILCHYRRRRWRHQRVSIAIRRAIRRRCLRRARSVHRNGAAGVFARWRCLRRARSVLGRGSAGDFARAIAIVIAIVVDLDDFATLLWSRGHGACHRHLRCLLIRHRIRAHDVRELPLARHVRVAIERLRGGAHGHGHRRGHCPRVC